MFVNRNCPPALNEHKRRVGKRFHHSRHSCALIVTMAMLPQIERLDTDSYVREYGLAQYVCSFEYWAGLWTKTRYGSRSRRCDLDGCEPARECISFGGCWCALGCGPHRLATGYRSDRVVVTDRDSESRQQLAGVCGRFDDHRPGNQCALACFAQKQRSSHPPA